MRLGTVIGQVTLSKSVECFRGARWLVVSPFTREDYLINDDTPRQAGPEPSLVVYDSIGGGNGNTIGFIEGREASMPFDQPTPVDAICAMLVDRIFYSPFSRDINQTGADR